MSKLHGVVDVSKWGGRSRVAYMYGKHEGMGEEHGIRESTLVEVEVTREDRVVVAH